MTWWVWTSKMNSEPVSACWQAAVSSGGGTVKRPPLPRAEPACGCDDGGAAQPANSKAASVAATAPAPCRKRRRSSPVRRAASSMDCRISSLTAAVLSLSAAPGRTPVGDRPGGEGQLVVGAVTQAAGEAADASHAGRLRPASTGLTGLLSGAGSAAGSQWQCHEGGPGRSAATALAPHEKARTRRYVTPWTPARRRAAGNPGGGTRPTGPSCCWASS